jgi:hypothetical protein
MKTPKCCGENMNANMDLGRFVEVMCRRCGDIIYIKQEPYEQAISESMHQKVKVNPRVA